MTAILFTALDLDDIQAPADLDPRAGRFTRGVCLRLDAMGARGGTRACDLAALLIRDDWSTPTLAGVHLMCAAGDAGQLDDYTARHLAERLRCDVADLLDDTRPGARERLMDSSTAVELRPQEADPGAMAGGPREGAPWTPLVGCRWLATHGGTPYHREVERMCRDRADRVGWERHRAEMLAQHPEWAERLRAQGMTDQQILDRIYD
jgi:hypothetical protein